MRPSERRVRNLVIKAIADVTGEDADEIAAQREVVVDDRDRVQIVRRLEDFFDCTLDLCAAPPAALSIAELTRRIRAITDRT